MMMQELQREEYRNRIAVSNELHQIGNLEYGMMNWFYYWHRPTNGDISPRHTGLYGLQYAVRQAVLVLLTLPAATTCTIERSFSTCIVATGQDLVKVHNE